MKKLYKTPLTEVMQAELTDMVMHSNDMAEGKENNDFFDMDDDEGKDPWGEKPDANKYDLWKD